MTKDFEQPEELDDFEAVDQGDIDFEEDDGRTWDGGDFKL